MLHKVVVPFPCSWDGITAVDLSVGDVRDFGSMADGLVGMGWIEPDVAEAAVADEMTVVSPTAIPVEPVAIEMAVVDAPPIEMAVVKRGRKRK